MSTKKALIVSPYLDHLGGGERYMLSVASVLGDAGYDLTFGWDNAQDIDHLASLLDLHLPSYHLAPALKLLYHSQNPWQTYLATRPYDLTVYLSDGSLPWLGSRRNFVHLQVPFHHVGGRSLKNRFKRLFCHAILVNSNFTKQVIDREFGLNSTVLYPPVPLLTPSARKHKMILSVGRFEPHLNVKRHDLLITAFRELFALHPDWRLVLAGGCSAPQWLAKLQVMAEGLPVTFATNLPSAKLQEYYQQASIYWHAAGYQVDEVVEPENTEHFGISTVEAISTGCVPLVVGRGGQREILPDNAYHWSSTAELVAKTSQQIRTHALSVPTLPQDYSLAAFRQHLLALTSAV